MKVAFLVPVRNKEKYLKMCVESVLNQTYSPMEIILSDQGSTDSSLSILHEYQRRYNGPNKVRVVQCPDLEKRYMAGFNVHLNWLHTQTDADVVLVTSADDFNHHDRTSKVVKSFEDFNPDMVGTAIQFINEDNSVNGETDFPRESRFIQPNEMTERLVGGSSSQAWRHDFYETVGGLPDSVIIDVYLPFLATASKGFYFIHELLYAYFHWADLENTGLGGVLRAAEGDAKKQYDEVQRYQITSTYFAILDHIFRINCVNDEVLKTLSTHLMGLSKSLISIRDELTRQRISPIGLRS